MCTAITGIALTEFLIIVVLCSALFRRWRQIVDVHDALDETIRRLRESRVNK